MNIDIRSIRQSSSVRLHAHRSELTPIVLSDDGVLAEPVDIELELRADSAGITGTCVMKVRLGLSCSRCLDRFEQELAHTWDFAVLEREPEPTEEAVEHWVQVQDDEIDLRDMIEEAIILTMPFRPLCSPDCRGICPGCGADLNHEECQCQGEAIDPRWEKLNELI